MCINHVFRLKIYILFYLLKVLQSKRQDKSYYTVGKATAIRLQDILISAEINLKSQVKFLLSATRKTIDQF